MYGDVHLSSPFQEVTFPRHLRPFPFGTASNWSRFQGICSKISHLFKFCKYVIVEMCCPLQKRFWTLTLKNFVFQIVRIWGGLYLGGASTHSPLLISSWFKAHSQICFLFPSSHLLLPTSITCLRLVNLYNLKSIASISLQSLISLKSLELYNCPKLWSFVPKGGQHLQYLKSGDVLF